MKTVKISDEAIDRMMKEYKDNLEESFIYKFIRDNDPRIQKLKNDGITDEELNKHIIKRIKTFEYDLKNRSNNTALNIINAFYERHDRKIQSFGENDISIEDYQILFDKLLHSQCGDNVLIPIKIHVPTGTGLYILGKENYAEGNYDFPKSYHCGIASISCWEQLTLEDGVCLHRLDSSYLDDIHDLEGLAVKEAVKYYEDWIADSQADLFSEIWNMNGNMPEGCPKDLQKYFADYFEEEEEGEDSLKKDDSQKKCENESWVITDAERKRVEEKFTMPEG